MNIIDRLKKWFFNEEKVGIINIGDIIQIPGREYFKEDEDKLYLIDNYKKTYYKLIKNKIISSKELSFDNVDSSFKMYTELVLSLLLDNKFEYKEIMNISDYQERKVNLYKINLYLEKIKEIKEDYFCKLIALEEINNSIVSLFNKTFLSSKINELKNIIMILTTNELALRKENNNFIMNINNNKVNLSDETIKQADEKKEFWLYDIAFYGGKLLLPKSVVENINQLTCNKYIKTALLEQEIEKYLYLNKNDIKNLIAKINELATIPKNKGNKEHLLKELKILENYYIIFKRYGHNIINKNDWYKYYQVKFDVLTCDLLSLKASPLDDAFINDKYNDEFNCYRRIVLDKISRISAYENEYLIDTFKDDTKEATRIILSIIKEYDNKLDVDRILMNRNLLLLLLAFDKKDGLKEMYDNLNVSVYDYHLKKLFNFLLFNKSIPTSTAYELFGIEYHQSHSNDYKLYSMMKKHEPISDIYYVPEGIRVIRNITLTDKNTYAYNYIRQNALNKVVVYPSTLKELYGNIFEGLNVKKVILNNGLYFMSNNPLPHHEKLVLPSSINILSEYFNLNTTYKTIVFEDYTNSGILNDYYNIAILFKNFFSFTEIVEQKSIKEENIIIYRKFSHVKINTKLKKIILNDGDQEFVIDPYKLLFDQGVFGNLQDIFGPSKNIREETMNILINRFMEEIQKETGYQINMIKKRKKDY